MTGDALLKLGRTDALVLFRDLSGLVFVTSVAGGGFVISGDIVANGTS